MSTTNQPNGQSEAVQRQPVKEKASPKARCIVVFGTKGGVGKTIVAANLAVSIAERAKKRVCLVDLDAMGTGDLPKVIGLNPQHSVAELGAHLRKRGPLPMPLPLEGLVTKHGSQVDVITCVLNPRHAQQLDSDLVHHLMATLQSRYDYVIVDGGKGLTDPLIASFDSANLILLVATPDIIALYQTKWAMNVIEGLLFPPSMVKAVLNRAESRGGVGSQDVRMAIPCELVGEIPSDGRAMGVAVNQGVPVVSLYGMSKVAGAFRKLADTLIDNPKLYLSHQEIPRHQKPQTEEDGKKEAVKGSSKLFAAAKQDGEVAADEIVALKRRIHSRLVEELDLKKVDINILGNPDHMQEMRERCERVIANILAREMGGVISSHEVRARLVREITDEALGLGPLEELLDDPSISDILVNNKDQIYIERRGRLELTTKKFISNDQVRAVIERIVAPLGRRIDESNPMVDARLPDGSRVNAIIPPLSVKGPMLSIRKFTQKKLTHEDLINLGSMTPAMAEFIEAAVKGRKNVIISGGTGSGKTTVLNVVSSCIPEGERIVTIEDAAELRLSQEHWVSLESRPSNVEGKGSISIRDLFRNALRMRPDRIVIGECRGGESLDMLQAMNTGHDGSMTTIHANSPKDVVARLDSMVLMSNVELPVRAIREMIASAIHVVIHTARLADGSRKVMSISELTELVDGSEIRFEHIFRFNQEGMDKDNNVVGHFETTGYVPSFLKELQVRGIPIREELFQKGTQKGIIVAPPQADT